MHERADCCLCSQIAGDPGNDLIASLLPGRAYVRRVIRETADFAVIPSLGPLVDGHVLLCTASHVRSFAELPALQHDPFQRLQDELVGVLAREYRAAVHRFEHGAARTGGHVPCTVDHAHLHLVPLPRGVDVELPASLPWRPIDASLGALAEVTRGGEYIRYETPGGECWIAVTAEDPFPSQLMRRVIAGALERPAWNWRDDPAPAAAHATWARLATA